MRKHTVNRKLSIFTATETGHSKHKAKTKKRYKLLECLLMVSSACGLAISAYACMLHPQSCWLTHMGKCPSSLLHTGEPWMHDWKAQLLTLSQPLTIYGIHDKSPSTNCITRQRGINNRSASQQMTLKKAVLWLLLPCMWQTWQKPIVLQPL